MKKIIAALIFFTRLPLYKWIEIPGDLYKNLVAYWSAAGWITAAVTAGILWLSAQVFPENVAVILALTGRLLLTGGLHEDGLADFFDGFGGGRTKEQILAIMKDSHIGSYGVISLILYFGLWFALIAALPLHQACITILIADPGAKFISSLIINRLPYARKVEESKVQVVYTPMSGLELLFSMGFGILPLILLTRPGNWGAIGAPLLFFLFFVRYLRKKTGGYTGDCCGALFLLNELIFILALTFFYQWN
ncbi:MAG: adenosylcobinamide-GDP ribazoletransferase [Bacteroidales bacterium]